MSTCTSARPVHAGPRSRPRNQPASPSPGLARTGPLPGRSGRDTQRGSMSVELVVWAGFLLMVLVVLAGLGRIGYGRELVASASASASRAASLAPDPTQAIAAAHQSAADTLTQAGLSCTHTGVNVNVTAFAPGGQVSVTVTCTADLSHLAIPGLPGHRTMSSTSTSPLEPNRDLTGAGA